MVAPTHQMSCTIAAIIACRWAGLVINGCVCLYMWDVMMLQYMCVHHVMPTAQSAPLSRAWQHLTCQNGRCYWFSKWSSSMIITCQVPIKDLLEYWMPLSIVVDDSVAFTPIAIDVCLTYNLTILCTIQYIKDNYKCISIFNSYSIVNQVCFSAISSFRLCFI